jgi:hypothetical protein
MRRPSPPLVAALVALPTLALAQPYTPPPAESIPGYSATVMPCKINRDGPTQVICRELDNKSLRELAILRNTIYARYGWDGFRKPWLREHFHAQPWFKPNPKFSYKLLTDADKKNAHFIAVKEQSFTEPQLRAMRDEIFARRGKVWNDKPEWKLKSGKTVRSCSKPKDADPDEYVDVEASNDCRFAAMKWYRPNPKFTVAELTAEDKIELGLLARAMGEFALDNETREKSESGSLDRLLKIDELRQLSLRDLRLLRNTIYARRGRPFKSQILQQHFNSMSWYTINPDYSDRLLSANDQRNIALIRSVENEFGGPLSDEDWLTEPAIDGA